MLNFSRVWLPYIYLYGAGGIIFISGMILILKARSLNTVKTGHRMWIFLLIFGFLWYMGIHGITTLAAIGRYNSALIIGIFMIFMTIGILFLWKTYRGTEF